MGHVWKAVMGQNTKVRYVIVLVLVGVALLTPGLVRLLRRAAFVAGVREGYRSACQRVFDAMQDTNDLASLSAEMGEPMDVQLYVIMLAERLGVSLNADVVITSSDDDDCDGEC